MCVCEVAPYVQFSDSANSPGVCTPAGCFLLWHRECWHTVHTAGLGLARSHASEKELFNTEHLSASHSWYLAPHTLWTAAYTSSSEAPQFCGRKRQYSYPPAQLRMQMGFQFRLKVSPITFLPPARTHMLPLTQKVRLIRRLFELKAALAVVDWIKPVRGWEWRSLWVYVSVLLMFVLMHKCPREAYIYHATFDVVLIYFFVEKY